MNIIFDLGGVVFKWDPQTLIDMTFTNKEDKDNIKKYLLDHINWINLDKGIISYDAVIKETNALSGIPNSKIQETLSNANKVLTPMAETIKLFKIIKEQGHSLYVLSNMHTPFARKLEEENDFWHLFNGIVFSCDVKMIKPNRDIYDYILGKYNLTPAETIFIDDTKKNVDTARTLGIDTIHFTTSKQCKKELIEKGII